jgi:hypothetical protein
MAAWRSVAGHHASPHGVAIPLDVFPRSIPSASWVPRTLPAPCRGRRASFVARRSRPSARLHGASRSSRPCRPSVAEASDGYVLRVSPPPGYDHRARRAPPQRLPRGSSAHGASRGFLPYSARGPGRPRTCAGFTSPGYGPPPGFRTLLTVSSAPLPPGLFHPGGAHGVLPFRAFPSRRAGAPLDGRCPPDVHVRGPTRCLPPVSTRAAPWCVRAGSPDETVEAANARLQGFTPSESPLPSSGGSGRRGLDALLGFYPSRDMFRAPDPTVDVGQLP